MTDLQHMQLKKISDQWKIRMVKMPFTIVKYIIPIDLTLFSLLSIKFVSPYFHFASRCYRDLSFSIGTSEKPATFGMIW